MSIRKASKKPLDKRDPSIEQAVAHALGYTTERFANGTVSIYCGRNRFKDKTYSPVPWYLKNEPSAMEALKEFATDKTWELSYEPNGEYRCRINHQFPDGVSVTSPELGMAICTAIVEGAKRWGALKRETPKG